MSRPSREAIHYEIEVKLETQVRSLTLYADLVSTLGDEAAIRRAITTVAIRELRSHPALTPPPSDSAWSGKVIYRVPLRSEKDNRAEEAGL